MTGWGWRDKKAYNKRHKYMTFTISANNKSFTKKTKTNNLRFKKPITFNCSN